MNDKLTMLLGANASGDFKLKPMFLYYSENLWMFTKKRVITDELEIYWKSNHKAWITRQMFIKL